MKTLANGNYVVVANNGGADSGLYIRILGPSGGNVLGFTAVANTESNGQSDTEADVTPLAGGGFVITYTNNDGTDTDTFFVVYNAAGTLVAGPTLVNGGPLTNNNNEAKVIGLADGSFVVAYDNDEANNGQIQHYSATGAALGSAVTLGVGIDDLSLTLTRDGRIVAVWSDGSDVFQQILDTRDAPNTGGSTGPFQIGTTGNDTFTGEGGNFTEIHGYDGDDVISESGFVNKYYGDAGNDTIKVVSGINSDIHDGGTGTDTIDWTGSSASNATFDLQAGTATAFGGGSVEQMLNFENLIGTGNVDIIFGTSGANILNGGGGNDTLVGRGGADNLIGGAGIDTADYTTSAAAVSINMATNVNTGGDAQGDLFTSIEIVVGSAFNDTMVGSVAGFRQRHGQRVRPDGRGDRDRVGGHGLRRRVGLRRPDLRRLGQRCSRRRERQRRPGRRGGHRRAGRRRRRRPDLLRRSGQLRFRRRRFRRRLHHVQPCQRRGGEHGGFRAGVPAGYRGRQRHDPGFERLRRIADLRRGRQRRG